MSVGRLWKLSADCHAGGHRLAARILKAIIFVAVRALLAPEARLGDRVTFTHHGIGTVVHPNVTIGDDVRIFHGVTLGTDVPLSDPRRMIIGDRTIIGAGAVVMGPINVGSDVVIGANAVVVADVPDGVVVAGNPAKPVASTLESRSKLVEAARAAADGRR